MKANSIFAAGFIFLLCVVFAATAQDLSGPVIKILPTENPEAIKLLVAENDGKSVDVRFFDEQGTIISDEIGASTAGNGFLKRYNLQKLPNSASVWMMVKASNTSVIYKFTKTKDGIESHLEEATYTYPVVAAR